MRGVQLHWAPSPQRMGGEGKQQGRSRKEWHSSYRRPFLFCIFDVVIIYFFFFFMFIIMLIVTIVGSHMNIFSFFFLPCFLVCCLLYSWPFHSSPRSCF